MSVFSRFADIVNANINAMLDRAEDPEKMVRLMVQEMEETLVEVRATAARVIADKKEAERRVARLRAAQSDWDRKAELALAKGREDLAKGALLEKAKLGESLDALEQELALLDDTLVKHDDDIARLEAKLREVKARQKAMQARQQTAESRVRVRRQVHDTRIDEAFKRFDHMERRIDASEGEAEAYDLGQRKSLSEEIADLEAEQRIADELEALKARVARRGGGSEPA